MKNKLIVAFGLCALLAGFTAMASAQNLYISSMAVGDGGYMYCNAGNNNGLGNDFHGMTNRGDVSFITMNGNVWQDSSLIQFERPMNDYPGGCLALCASVMCLAQSTPTLFGVDDLTFEIFKFGPGANPLDPSSTPPIKTVSIFAPNMVCNQTNSAIAPTTQDLGTQCAAWDGFYNLNGFFGKTNGLYGFRAKVTTRQTASDGTSIDIEQTAAFPGQNQIPIQVNVTNIHMVQSSPTPVGNLTRVPAQPYNIKYRLSKDATATITIWDTDVSHYNVDDNFFPAIVSMPLVRTIISSQPRVGEGVPDGILANGDFWDGRNSSGTIVPAGSYLARIEAGSNDSWPGADLAWPATIQMTLDPLQVTDVGIRPLGVSSTDMATISFLLTEPATAYVEIYTPGTLFSDTNTSPPVLLSGTLLRRFKSQETGRQGINAYWDGRDQYGSPVCDGDYVYAIYAELPSSGNIGWHQDPLGVDHWNYSWDSVKTRRTTVGTVPVARGEVMAFMSPSSSVIGSSPTAAGLDPFYFRYTPTRNTMLSLNIKQMDGVSVVRRVVENEVRFANVLNREIWDGKLDDGTYASSNTYLAELITVDPYQCTERATSTMTALIPVHMFRIVDVRVAPLLGGASAYGAVSFELSQTMFMELNIYNANATVNPSLWPWRGADAPGPALYSVQGLRPGRMRINEPWDGRRVNGEMVPDGHYPFTLIAYTTGTAQTMYATDKVYGYVDVSRGQILFTNFEVYPTIPNMYNSSGTINLPPYGIESAVTRQSSVTVQIINTAYPTPDVYAELVTGELREGEMLYKDFWDGKCTKTTVCGNYDYAPRGSYYVRILAQDLGLELKPRTTVQQLIEFSPIRIFDLAITPLTESGPAVVSYQLSEPMMVATKIYKPGTNLPSPNNDPPDGLVKLIVGMRPARTQINEFWDGTDRTLSVVPDGNYVFRVYGSTLTNNINTLYGTVVNPNLLSEDIIINNIPVIKSASTDLCGDFARESYFAPNPYTGTTGWFHITAITNGLTDLSIYNLAGDLVYKKDYGLRAKDAVIEGNNKCPGNEACWPKVNSSGRTVSPGVYFAVIRFEAAEGTRGVCQVVKKILIP